MIFTRSLESRLKFAFSAEAPRKVVCLFGPRQAGKTTLLRRLYAELTGAKEFLNGDFSDDCALLRPERSALRGLADHLDYLFIDEAQNVPEIGRVLKLLHDEFPRLRVAASGSASFDLRNKTGEPLTGRQTVFDLFPLSLRTQSRDDHLAPVDRARHDLWRLPRDRLGSRAGGET
jgi:predicted AAA+ superfamily ATPase